MAPFFLYALQLNTMYKLHLIISLSLLIFSGNIMAKINVLACEAEWAALTHAIAGDTATIYSATNHLQDAHYIQARPSLIAKARRADLLICSGASLEQGWLPVLIRKSGNHKIKPGAAGYFMATDYVELLEKPKIADRSHGDIHMEGNPHVHFDPNRMLIIAKVLVDKLSSIMPSAKALYQQNYTLLRDNIEVMLDKYANKIAELKGAKVVVHHHNWIYLLDWLSMERRASLEDKPGIPPSAKHLQKLTQLVNNKEVIAILVAGYQNQQPSDAFNKKTGIPKVVLDYSPVDPYADKALITWYESILNALTNV